MLANLVELVREHTDIFNDDKTLREMLTFVKKDGGKQEAEDGYHDDKVMSIAIAHQATSQVVFIDEPIEMPSQHYFTAERKREVQYDYGEEMTIV